MNAIQEPARTIPVVADYDVLGCGFDLGHPETGTVQPISLIALRVDLKVQEIEGFYRVDA